VAAIAGEILDEKAAGQLSTLFDVGGVVGGILAGHISDKMNARAITAAGFMYCAIPSLFLYRTYGSVNLTLNIVLMVVAGMLINGPYALITTAVSADLGTHSSLQGNGRALATVTAIIDGTGSMGAAVGPLLTGYLSGRGWGAVFIMLMVAALFAGLLLTKLVVAEVVEKLAQYQRLENLADSARHELTGIFLSLFPFFLFNKINVG
jgi:OPA family glycerol-3-phosphate transporter-like MFS transporter 1/2